MANAIQGYTIVAYPESMPNDFVARLDVLDLGYCYSLHDKDVDESGVLKKAHIHFYFYGSPTTKQKKYISASLGLNSLGQSVRNSSAMFDYLTHENDPNKYHYPKDNIIKSAKWNQELFDCSYVPKVSYHADIVAYIETNNILEYCDFMDAVVFEHPEWMAEAKLLWCMRLIDSRRNKSYRS